jgi:hypothetical protein
MSDAATALDQRSTVRTGAARAAGRQQLTVAAAQIVSGLGNLMFALVAVRVLGAESWARLAAFLAAILLIGLPAASLTAAGALNPSWSQSTRPCWLRVAGGLSITLITVSLVLSRVVHVPVLELVAVGFVLPPLVLLALDRGVLFGSELHRPVANSLLVEAFGRLLIGGVLATMYGLVGALAGVVIATYASLAATTVPFAGAPLRSRRRPSLRVGAPTAAGFTFLVLGVLQTQDLFVANARLDGVAAAQFAVLSTLGGAAVFATATVPMVLLPQLKDGRPRATTTAIGLTAAVGLAVTIVGLAAARPLLRVAFGPRYEPMAALVPIYLLGMASLAVCRVVAARRCTSDPARLIRTCVIAAGLHLVALLVLGRSPGSVVAITTVTMLGLGTALVAPDVFAVPSVGRRKDAIVAVLSRPTVLALAGLSAVALGLRVVMFRGLWVDEAISVRQARLPLGTMLQELAATDVHPPLHHLMLWATTRILGVSELGVRLPSILAGVALIPLLFYAGSLLYSRRVGWVAALLAVPSPLMVWYAQEARMYALFMALAVGAICAQVLAVRHGERRHWIAYILCTAALAWTQYFALLPFVVQQVAFAAVVWSRRHERTARRRLLIGWAASLAAIAALVAPLAVFVAHQAAAGASGWLGSSATAGGLTPSQAGAAASDAVSGVSVYGGAANLIWALWGYHADITMIRVTALWPLAMLGLLTLLGRGWSRASTYLVALVAFPMAALAVVDGKVPGAFELRYASATIPVAVILLARFLTAMSRRLTTLVCATALVGGVLVVGLMDQQINSANPRRYDFSGALARVEHEAQPGDVIVYDPVYLADVVGYYAPNLIARPLDGGLERIAPGRGVWVLAASHLEDPKILAAQIGTALVTLQDHRQLAGHFTTPNVEVWELR